jgi:hypothetical protein
MEIAYYTCLNNECYKYRGIFMEGDPEHANCERARLYLEGESRTPGWAWFALPIALAGAVATAAFVFMRRRAAQGSHRPPMGERKTEMWSGAERMNDERRGHPVPPPIAHDTMS